MALRELWDPAVSCSSKGPSLELWDPAVCPAPLRDHPGCDTQGAVAPSSVLLLTPCWDAAAAEICLPTSLLGGKSHQVWLNLGCWAAEGGMGCVRTQLLSPWLLQLRLSPFCSTVLETQLIRGQGKAIRTALGTSEKSHRVILQAVPWFLQGTVKKPQPNHFQCPSLALPAITQPEK